MESMLEEEPVDTPKLMLTREAPEYPTLSLDTSLKIFPGAVEEPKFPKSRKLGFDLTNFEFFAKVPQSGYPIPKMEFIHRFSIAGVKEPIDIDEWRKARMEDILAKFHVEPKTLDLKFEEVRELSDGVFIKKTKNGLLEIYVIEE